LSAPDVLAAIVGQARLAPHRSAVKDTERELTYDQLITHAARMSTALAASGVTEGDRVALLLPNSVDFVVAALATLWLDAIFVPLSVSDPVARQGVIVRDCAPTVVINTDNFGELAASEAQHPPGSLHPAHSHPNIGAYIIYTSGTTGTPNGVLIGRPAFAAAVADTVDALSIGPETRTLCVSPFHFDGSFGTLFPTLCSGGSIVIRPRDALLFPRTFFRAVANEGITYTGFSPSYLRLLLNSPELSTMSDTSLELIALGGEASSAADIEAFWAVAPQVTIFNRYGPTESTIAVTHKRVTPEMVKTGIITMGQPHDGVTFHLFDESSQLVDEPDTVGELFIGGDQLMTGYWGSPDLTSEVLRTDLVDGETLYRTGDLVYRDASGDYVYVDRADRVINRSGVRISLIELGDTLRNLNGVSAAACVTFDNEGQLGIAAFIVTDDPQSSLDLRQSTRRQLPDTMLPDRIVLVEELPLTNSSKLDERRLLTDAGLVGLSPHFVAE
jgi:amino acid adenylation domain-containing protein